MQQKVKTKVPNNQLFDLTVKNESLSNRIEELEKEVTHLQKQKGGYVKNNNEYRGKVKQLEFSNKELVKDWHKKNDLVSELEDHILEFSVQITERDVKIKRQVQQIDGLRLDVKYSKENQDKQRRDYKGIIAELNSIKSKWWHKMFNW